MRRARELHARGEMAAAEGLYLQVLRAQPRNAGALHLLGVLTTQAGNPERALDLIAESIAIDPTQAAAFSNLGNALMALGRYAEAVQFFNRALDLKPQYAIALANRGISLIHLGDFEQAADSLSRALDRGLQRPETLLNRGIAFERLGHLDKAIADYEAAIALKPDYAEPAFNRAILLATLDRNLEAVAAYDRVIVLKPDHADALNNRGVALLKLERFDEAMASVETALAVAPDMADAHNNRGLALLHLKRLDRALECFDRALELRPEFPEALSNHGRVLLSLGRREEAIRSLEKALKRKPDFVEALTNLGAVLKSCERPGEALSCFERALKIDPDYQDALAGRSVLLMEARRFADAMASLERLLAVAPENEHAPGILLEAQMRCCDWSEYPILRTQIGAAVLSGRQPMTPLAFLAVTDDPALQLACARAYAERNHWPSRSESSPAARDPRSPRDSKQRIRLAYVSGDLSDHAVAYLTAGLFEQHDRERFEVIAISLRPPHDSAIGRRIQASVGEFLDVSSMSDELIVARMRDLDADIAVDLSGYTGAGRPGIFAARAAPVQVNYLGFPATMGMPCMDYIIADEFLIPPQSRAHYAEQVAYLPNCFQANDRLREIGKKIPSKTDCGLPEQGVILCSFNGSYKLNPEFFAVWLRLLAATPGAVLWILGDNEWVKNNLLKFASSRGIAAERLVFAHTVPYAEHLARLSLADLCLDTLPFNAGTTASDALWSGVPVLTCAGSGFAARMAGSLLRAVGLPELITHSIEEYEALGLRLAGNPALLGHFRARLAAGRLTAPLFDTARFCRNIESAYSTMWERCRRGEPPASFRVSE